MLALIVPVFLDKFTDAIFIAKIQLFIIPSKILSSYANAVLISKSVNRQNILPFIQVGATVFLVAGVFTLNYFDSLDLYSFVIVDVVGYILYHLVIIFLYYKYYFKSFIYNKV